MRLAVPALYLFAGVVAVVVVWRATARLPKGLISYLLRSGIIAVFFAPGLLYASGGHPPMIFFPAFLSMFFNPGAYILWWGLVPFLVSWGLILAVVWAFS